MQLNQYAQECVQTEHLSYEEWLQYRRRGIGGSDIAAICGISKWRIPMHVYLEKLGESPDQVKMRPRNGATDLKSSLPINLLKSILTGQLSKRK